MSLAPSPSPSFPNQLAAHFWWILLLAALGLLGLATERRIDRIEAISDTPTWSVDAPLRDPGSPTGFEQGQRRIIIPGHHGPSFTWIIEAQLSAEQGDLRLRRIDYDAPPDGREIRRTALYRWWLIAAGWLYGSIAGEDLGYSIERGALFADPLLLALILVLGAVYCARYVGAFAAIGFVAGGISLFPLAASFQPGAPDPRSLAWTLAIGSLLPLFVATQTKHKGRHLALAGALGGFGFWNDASSQAPLLLALFLGAVCYELVRWRGVDQGETEPMNWRIWAWTGGLTLLAASCFEFAPSQFSWSLDSVNPLHALIWWGFGETLQTAGNWSRQGRIDFSWHSTPRLIAAALAMAAWPVAGMLSDSGALLAADFYARELANHPNGVLAANLMSWLSRDGGAGAKWVTLLPSALLFLLLLRICLGDISWEARGRLSMLLVAAAAVFVLAFHQLRWWNLFDTLALLALTALFAEAAKDGVRARWRAAGASLLILPGLLVGFPAAVGESGVDDLSPMEAQALVEREFSYWLAKRSGDGPNVLFSTPIFSSAAAYYGGFTVTASSDDSNEIGFLTAVRIASASSEQEVSILLNSRNITHLVLPMWDPMLDQLVRIGRSLPPGQPLPQNAFSVSLQDWDIPLWMQPMSYPMPPNAALQGFEIRAFAIGAEQTPELGLSRLADLFIERSQLMEARSLREALTAYSRSVIARGAIARVDFATRDAPRLAETLEALIPALSRRTARDLPPDRRISLAILFIQSERADLARDQITACFEELTPEILRSLSPNLTLGLIAVSRSLEIPFPDANLETMALKLVPLNVRQRFAK